ncbi:hypothetical protein [Auraticoccus monumenti]|uniref:Uncharacterized protein n=1 Tax=Auraticoccus monumenti TaxID=675864 RepID=A0A1G6ZVU0_9ACTN|nr:hypothetical protein [Auraticoccus monumenti]SDE06347.1 hypothetical protein SAMN04489747_2409 [Auraticoccus monumenti]
MAAQQAATGIGQADGAGHPGHRWWHRWPTVLGLGVAALLLATGAAGRETVAIGASAAAWCYLAAAALGRRWLGWVAIPVASLVVVGSELVGLPWWVGLGATGLVLLVLGVLRSPVARSLLLAQAAAFAVVAGLAVLALAWDPWAGLVLAGLVLASHAGWDVVHHRRDVVVSRSLAEACLGFDLLLGLGLIAVALLGR